VGIVEDLLLPAKRLNGSSVTSLEVLLFTKDTKSFANINSVSTFGFLKAFPLYLVI
jgi:hypothetical protein